MEKGKLTHPVDVEQLPELPASVREAIFSPPRQRKVPPKKDQVSIVKTMGSLFLLSVLFLFFTQMPNIEVWICDRLDWLPRSVALDKIKQDPGNETIIPVAVTGIKIINSNERLAEFDWEIKPTKDNPTPTHEHFHSSVTFRLYDDGWRVQ